MTSSIPVVNNAPLLDVRDLCVDFVNGSAVTHAVRGVSFQLGHEKLAIVGESGSGKSTVGRALLQLHPKKALLVINLDNLVVGDKLYFNSGRSAPGSYTFAHTFPTGTQDRKSVV